jgi:DNA-binding CsgD family transcriptional regulator
LLALVKNGFDRVAVNSLRAGVAVIDDNGVVRWTNQAWRKAEPSAPRVAGAREGSNLGMLAEADGDPLLAAVLAGFRAVIAGATSYVELQSEAGAGRPVVVAITPTRGRRGAVILYAESGAIRAIAAGAPVAIDASRIAEHLTPRELEVLTHMAAGQSNRAIASELGIEYTTVRGHVQSVLAKLGARSRVDAVASAYRSGIVREAALAFDGKPRRDPRDKAANDISGVREAKVV